ncbi:DUF4192 domain-containing protein [Mycolicibacterium goodii]|nr:DUF4192 domain-containing protein [Mycolicibacterium goodii]
MDKIRVLGNVVRDIVAMLGFAPAESLVLVLLRDGELYSVMRADLRDMARADAAVRLVEMVARQDANGVVGVIVSEEASMCPPCRERLRSVVNSVASELEQRGDWSFDAVIVDQIRAGARWSCLGDSAMGGVLDDPASSALAAAAVLDGRRMYGSRAELAATVAVDVERVAAMAPLLGAVGAVEDVAVAVRAAVDAMRRMAGGAVLTDAELADVATTLVDVRVRDALFNVGDSDAIAAAESLWTLLARVLPDPFRAEALTLLALSAYVRGDGPVAGIALDAVLVDNPGHRMAGMLDVALQNGMRPEQLQGLIAKIPAAVTV